MLAQHVPTLSQKLCSFKIELTACAYDARRFYDIFKVQHFIWPGNSTNLNLIKLCWVYVKTKTTKDGPPRTREEAAFR